MQPIEIFGYITSTPKKVPLYLMSVSAGIPIPAESDIDQEVDLNEFLVEHPAATFFAKINGNSFEKAGIYHGDILIVDSSIEPTDGKFVLVLINSDLAVRIYRTINGSVYLQSENRKFVPLEIEPYIKFDVIGVVTKVIHSL